jgi:hypothetical protein
MPLMTLPGRVNGKELFTLKRVLAQRLNFAVQHRTKEPSDAACFFAVPSSKSLDHQGLWREQWRRRRDYSAANETA